ncbi:DUF1289 domain-containing protein [Chitiniphilus purpureus]|uniref:DUF1289 domain-containing protein n=1 Tax=Chitiniphilus purpureus TaxID=2981137 RepID=A0ABY6DL41_9NEIS|nr:cysteine-rich CWC family protein [Chitiniphilus sp. CD1]UXY15070.1 DUF1289 domain-containing protein [Chitiniphilus sp. CD1]
MPASTLPSPCIGVCTLDPATQTCRGCHRTLDEIAAWSRLDAPGKARVWQRLGAQPVPPGWQRKRCAGCGAPFGCGAAAGTCWCMQLPPLPVATPAIDCLCPACLDAALHRA